MLMKEFIKVRALSKKGRAEFGTKRKMNCPPIKVIPSRSIGDMQNEIENEEEGVVSKERKKVNHK